METFSIHFEKETEIPYSGPELRPHFLLQKFGIKGTGMAAFMGPCRVETASLVDWEDRLESDRIEAKKMLHFLGEFFQVDLRAAVTFQHLLIANLMDILVQNESLPGTWTREGNDLYWSSSDSSVERKKLSVSIVTASPVSTLLHLGINLDPFGAPVSAVGLEELGINAQRVGQELLERAKTEWERIAWSCVKVRPVF